MGCVQSYFRKAHNAGLSPSSTHGSVKAGIPQDATDDVEDLVNQPEKEPLDVTDIQNEDEVNLTEKPNESAPELNGTVKTHDGDAGKLVSIVTGISAATGAAAVAAENLNSEEKQELSEDGEIVTQSGTTSVSASPAPALSEADTADVTEVGEVKSPLSVKLEDEEVVVEAASIKSDTAWEAEEERSVSIPITQDTAESNEEVPREPVPEEKLSTATSEDTPAQGSRPTSASQIAVNEEEDGSEPTNATVDGTIRNSASSVKLETVPEQEQDAESRRSSTCKEPSSNGSPSSSEQGTESQKDDRPFSVTASNKETSRPASSVSLSKENADTANDANESGTGSSSPTTTDKIVDGPVSGSDGKEIPGNGTLSVKDDKREDTKSAGSEGGNTQVSETPPITFSIKEEGSRPVSAAELTNEEDSRPEVSIEDAVQVSEDRKGSRPVSALTAGEEIERVTEEDTEVCKEPAGSPLSKADESEDDRIRLELSPTDATTVSSQATEGSRPVNFTESTKEGGTLQFSAADATKEDVEIPQEPTESPPPNVNNIEEGESIPRNSATDVTENFKGTADSRPASVTESTKDEERKSVDGTESAEKEGRGSVNSGVSNAEVSENSIGSPPVSAVELTTDEGCQPTSDAEKITVVEENPVNITLSEKFEESRGSPLAQNEDSDESAPTQAISDSVEEEEVHPARVEGPTEGAESRAVSVLEDAKKKGKESVTLENIQASEDRSDSAANSTKEEGSRPVSAAVPTESTNRPASSIVEGVPVELGESKILANEGNRSESSTEITKEGNSTVTDVELAKEVVVNSSVSAAESTTEEKGSRPLSGVSFMQEEGNRPPGVAGVLIEEGGRTASVSESIKEEGSGPVISEPSSKEERIESAKEESIRPGTVLNAKKEESRRDSPEESTTEENRLVDPSGSAKDQDSRPSSIAADESGPTETSESRQDSVSGSVTEEGNVSASYATGNLENPEEQRGNIPVSSESTNEGYRPTSSVSGKESSGEKQTEAEVGNKDTEVAAESTEDFQALKSPEKQPPSEAVIVDVQEETENEKSIVEVDNSSSPPSILLSDGTKFEVSKEASEQGGLSSSPVTEKTESVASFTDSAQARTDDIIPSLGATMSSNEPGSDEETDVPVVEDKTTKDEEKPATDDVDVEKPTKDESEELNTAATIIQATFRGYQTRQALSKTTQKDEVPQSLTSHDFLFGPPVQQSAVSEETSVDRVAESPETGEKQQEGENELAELQKPQEWDEIRATQDGASDDVSDGDSSLSTAATKIQAGVRGFLARRHVHNMKTSNSTTAPSIGESQQSVGDSLTSQEVEDEGVHTSGSLETEIQKQHQITVDDEVYQPQEEAFETEKTELQNRLSLDSQLQEKAQKPTVARSAVSLNLDGMGNEEEDRRVWETLQQQELDDAATKIQSNYRGYRMRRSLKREDAVQMPTTSSSSLTASSDVIPDPIRHSGEFHDMMVLPPSPEEDAADSSAQNHVVTASSTPLHADDDVKSPAGNQETDVTRPSQVGVAKMDDSAENTAAEAATKIQSSYRGFKTRQDIKAANTAASKIQAGFRGYKVRKQLRENTVDNKNGPRSQGSRPQSTNQDTEANEIPTSDIEERSATKIQASVRGFLVRKKRQTERNAAVKIQAGFRGYQARREVKARRLQQQNN